MTPVFVEKNHDVFGGQLVCGGISFYPHARPDPWVTLEDRHRAVAQRAAEVSERRAVIDAKTTIEETRQYTGTLAHTDPNWTLELLILSQVVHGG